MVNQVVLSIYYIYSIETENCFIIFTLPSAISEHILMKDVPFLECQCVYQMYTILHHLKEMILYTIYSKECKIYNSQFAYLYFSHQKSVEWDVSRAVL